jgi:chemotaxis protein histidine kinase CheA
MSQLNRRDSTEALDSTKTLETLKREFALLDPEIIEEICVTLDNDLERTREKLRQIRMERDQEHLNEVIDMTEMMAKQIRTQSEQTGDRNGKDAMNINADTDLLMVIQNHIHDFFVESKEQANPKKVEPEIEQEQKEVAKVTKRENAKAKGAPPREDPQAVQVVVVRKKANNKKARDRQEILKLPEKSPPSPQPLNWPIQKESSSISTSDDFRQNQYLFEDDFGPSPGIDQESVSELIRPHHPIS